MKIYHQLVALLFILLATKQMAFAQDNTYPFTHLDVGKGLSHNRVTNIVKDEKGFLWFGTANGLNRFDGYKFKVYKHQPADSTSLNEDFISSIRRVTNFGSELKLDIRFMTHKQIASVQISINF